MYYNIFKSRDPVYIKKLFSQKREKFFPGIKDAKITNLKIKEVSPFWAKDTCLNKYDVQLNNKYIRKIRETSETKKSKRKVWEIMNFVYKSSMEARQKSTARPIDFLSRYNMLFYEEVPGTTLAQLIADNNVEEIKKALILAAQWLSRLHRLPVNSRIKKAFYPQANGYKILFKKIAKYLPSLKKDLLKAKLLEFTDKIWRKEKVLIHADFYPSNIIVNKNQLFIIDFDKSGLGPGLMDVATLYGCLEFPSSVWELKFNQKQIRNFQTLFLRSYCKTANLDYIKTKKKLRKFLAKIFLDQIRYYFFFDFANIKQMSKEHKASLTNKLQDLISKVKEYL